VVSKTRAINIQTKSNLKRARKLPRRGFLGKYNEEGTWTRKKQLKAKKMVGLQPGPTEDQSILFLADEEALKRKSMKMGRKERKKCKYQNGLFFKQPIWETETKGDEKRDEKITIAGGQRDGLDLKRVESFQRSHNSRNRRKEGPRKEPVKGQERAGVGNKRDAWGKLKPKTHLILRVGGGIS